MSRTISRFLLSFLAVCSSSGRAQLPAFEGQLAYVQTQLRSLDVSAGPTTLHMDPKTQSGLALRGAWAWPLRGAWSVDASLGYRFQTKGGLDYRVSPGPSGSLDVKQVLEHQIILGGLVRWTGAATFGAGLDLRQEALSVESSDGKSSGTLTRPWFRAVARYPLGGGALQPFLGLELALPLTKESVDGVSYIGDLDRLGEPSNPYAGSVAKAHGPSFEFALVFGLRFGGAK